MKKMLGMMALFAVAGFAFHSANAEDWFPIYRDTQCMDCVAVEPNPFAHYGNKTLAANPLQLEAYQVHYLKAGETPTYFDYNCWGCDENDYNTIFHETGLWYYPK